MDDNGAIYLGIPDPSVEGMPADVIGMDKDEAKTAVENASNNKIEVILEPRFSAKKDFGKIVASNYIFGAPFEASNEENDYKILQPIRLYYGVGADNTEDVVTTGSGSDYDFDPHADYASTSKSDRSLPYISAAGEWRVTGTYCKDGFLPGSGGCISLISKGQDGMKYGSGYPYLVRKGDESNGIWNDRVTLCTPTGDIGGCILHYKDGSIPDNETNMRNHLLAKQWGMFEMYRGYGWPVCDGTVYRGYGETEGCDHGQYVRTDDIPDGQQSGATYEMDDFYVYFPVGSKISKLEDSDYFSNKALAAANKAGKPDTDRPFFIMRDPKGYKTTSVEAYKNGEQTTNPFVPGIPMSGGYNPLVKMDVAPSATVIDDSSSSSSSADASSEDSAIANTSQSSKKFVAAGLYLPVYLASQGNGNAEGLANTMMTGMDNSAGNQAVGALGGWSAVNSWLSSHGYSGTSFNRDFGDVQASNAGYENYSTARDAARMLVAVDAVGGTGLMNTDIASEGVVIPSGMTVHAHRGMGIQNTWNYFAIVEVNGNKAAVSVVTQNQGQDRAAQLMSQVLASVDSTLRK
ncbi:serine hydrolase [uncultured Bifidobacterium sp.]|uniref:serine hydrolase n=1 Tax=uncultured Bifidobacterium sp. TaxID=165187 RepID=UPI0025975A5B|nr:serine hydrolase [uncultured Bifidobacterium sp.]